MLCDIYDELEAMHVQTLAWDLVLVRWAPHLPWYLAYDPWSFGNG